jgi:hypothetical protein
MDYADVLEDFIPSKLSNKAIDDVPSEVRFLLAELLNRDAELVCIAF